MGLLDIFRGKKKKEAEKQDWINKLEPYKDKVILAVGTVIVGILGYFNFK